MDPVSAIGLAASVAQLVDLSYKLVSAGVEVWEVASESYTSRDGKTATNRHAEVTARDFMIVTERLSSSIDSCKLSPDVNHDRALVDLAGAAVKIGQELLEHLERARVRERHRLWQSFRNAVESVWSKGDVENVAQKLRGYREQIQYHVLVSMRDQVKWIDLHSSTQFNSLDESAKKILTALYNNEQIFADRLDISTNEVKQHVTNEIRPVKDGLQYLNSGVEEVLLILRAPSSGIQEPSARNRQQGRTSLHDAAEAGRLAEVQEILRSKSCVISAVDEAGRNALHVATMAHNADGYEDIVKCLLARRLDPNSEDHVGRTALHYAAENGHATMVRYLLLNGANRKAEDFDGHQPRHNAEPHSIINWMLLNGPDVDVKDVRQRTALNNAAARGNNRSVRWLLDNNANMELKNEWGLTPLAEASRHGHCDTVKMLIDHGANLEAATETKKTPLWRAVEEGQTAVVRQLLEKQAKTDVCAYDGRTPLIVATEKSFTDIVRLLLVNGEATECAEAQKRRTPLMIAARQGFAAVVLELLKYGAKVNAVDKVGNSALAHACKGNGQADVIWVLLENGAATDINKKNINGFTPLTHAAWNGVVPISKALLDNGADIDSETKEGMTAMKLAVDKRHEDLARFLLDRGALVKK